MTTVNSPANNALYTSTSQMTPVRIPIGALNTCCSGMLHRVSKTHVAGTVTLGGQDCPSASTVPTMHARFFIGLLVNAQSTYWSSEDV